MLFKIFLNFKFNYTAQILEDFLDTLNSAEPQIIFLIPHNRKSNCLELQINKIDVLVCQISTKTALELI